MPIRRLQPESQLAQAFYVHIYALSKSYSEIDSYARAERREEEQRRSIPLYSDDWARMATEGALCVAGDFNARLRMPTDGLRAETKVARELLNEALRRSSLVPTTESLDYCIDHICLSEAWAQRAGLPQRC